MVSEMVDFEAGDSIARGTWLHLKEQVPALWLFKNGGD